MSFRCSRKAVRILICVLLLATVVCPFGTVAVSSQSSGYLIQVGDKWRYFKGYSEASEPPTAWREVGFDDSGWLVGPTGVGYGDGDDATVLDDMEGHYVSVYLRCTFLANARASALQLEVDWDDGFIAYLNGTEIARQNMDSGFVPFDAISASAREAGTSAAFAADPRLLQLGENVLAIQVHNRSLGSSDLTMKPALWWEQGGGVSSLLVWPYLGETTTDSVTIGWATDEPGSGEVWYSLDRGYGQTVPAASALHDGKYWHAATLNGLAPRTAYWYRVVQDGKDVTPWGNVAFWTAPGSVVPFVFGVLGDTQGQGEPVWQMADMVAQHDPDFVLRPGDLVSDGGICSGSDSAWAQYIADYFDVYQEHLGRRPYWPCVGNHDLTGGECGYEAFGSVFHLPGNGTFYSFDWANVHFVALDTNVDVDLDPGAPEYDWLVADLEANERSWTVVFFHHPAYSSGHHGSTPRVYQDLVPVLEAYDVDLAFSGHDHSYERTCPIYKDECVDDGVVYVVSGGGGAILRPVDSSWFTEYSESIYHFVKVTVDGCRLRLEAIDIGGSVFDSYEIDRCVFTYLPLIMNQGSMVTAIREYRPR